MKMSQQLLICLTLIGSSLLTSLCVAEDDRSARIRYLQRQNFRKEMLRKFNARRQAELKKSSSLHKAVPTPAKSTHWTKKPPTKGSKSASALKPRPAASTAQTQSLFSKVQGAAKKGVDHLKAELKLAAKRRQVGDRSFKATFKKYNVPNHHTLNDLYRDPKAIQDYMKTVKSGAEKKAKEAQERRQKLFDARKPAMKRKLLDQSNQ